MQAVPMTFVLPAWLLQPPVLIIITALVIVAITLVKQSDLRHSRPARELKAEESTDKKLDELLELEKKRNNKS